MTESDLFVDLLDDKELDRIIKDHKIVMDGFRPGNATIAKKRATLRTAFKQGLSKKVNGSTFFFNVINRYSLSLEDIDDESYLAALSECHAPDYIKLAYSLVYRKHVIKEFLPDIILRHQSGEESLFNYSYLIVSDEIAIRVVKNGFGLNNLNNTFTSVENSFNVQQKRTIAKIIKEVKDLSFHEFIKMKNEMKKNFDEQLILFTYGKLRTDLDPLIRAQYAFAGALFQIRFLINSSAKSTQEDAQRLKDSLEKLQESLQEKDKLLKQSIKDSETIYELQTELAGMQQTQKNEVSIPEHSLDQINAKHQYEIKALTEKHNEELEELRDKLRIAQEGINRSLNRISHWAGDREECNKFTIIYSHPTHLFLELYPEISAFYIGEWEQHIEDLKTFPVVYVQRDGCSTAMLTKIQNNIKNIKVFNALGDKELIEHIEEIKKREGVLFVTV